MRIVSQPTPAALCRRMGLAPDKWRMAAMRDDLPETRPDEATGVVYCIEFAQKDNDEELREPGTYVTIRIDDPNLRWSAGRVAIRYLVSK